MRRAGAGSTRREETIMTQDRAKKKATRQRMAGTGEPYTVAKRATEAERQAQEQAAELARQADAMRDKGIQIYHAAQQYVAAARTGKEDIQAIARQLGEAMDQGMAEVVAAVQNLAPQSASASLSGKGSLVAGGHVMAFAGLAEATGVAPNASVITVSDSENVRPENLDNLLARASRNGIAGLSTVQVLAVVLVCLLAIGTPLAQLTLPPEAQALLADEYSTLGLGLAIALLIVQNRKR